VLLVKILPTFLKFYLRDIEGTLMLKKIVCACFFISVLSLTACSTPGQNVYDFTEAGQSVLVEFGTVVDVNPITIKGPNTGVGAGVGAVAGAGLGSQVGNGNGALAAAIGGAIAGAVAGAVAEQAAQDKSGFVYTITTEHGKTITIPQYYHKDEKPIKVGERVMVQTSGSYQRVLPAEHLPTQIKRPKGIKVVD
jgi:outer membrane lipoprotein SlyB